MQSKNREVHQLVVDEMMERLPSMDVAAVMESLLNEGVHPDQVCRTCTKTGPDRIIVSLDKVAQMRKANDGVLPKEASCQPSDSIKRFRVTQERQVEAIRAFKSQQISIPGITQVKLQTTKERVATGGMVDTCGQVIQDKCKSCARFHRIEMRIIGGVGNSGQPYLIDALVGGHCKIPVEGIVIHGKETFCDKQPLVTANAEERQSCHNCAWQQSYGESSMLDHVTPLRGGLTSYEREMASRNADPDRVGAAINEASRNRAKVTVRSGPRGKQGVKAWTGMLKFFKLEVVRFHEEDGVPVSVDVKIPGTGDEFNFMLNEGDDTIGMIKIIDVKHVILEILSPHQHKYGLPSTDKISYPGSINLGTCPTCNGNMKHAIKMHGGRTRLEDCTRCGGTGKINADVPVSTIIEHDMSDRVDPACTHCWGNKPCHHHMRLPYDHEDRGVIRLLNGQVEPQHVTTTTYAVTDSKLVEIVETPEQKIRLVHDAHGVHAEDDNGNTPLYAIFRVRMRSLMDACRNADERAQLMSQFNKVPHGVYTTRLIDFSWVMPAPQPAFHPFCSLNLYDQEHGHPDHKGRANDVLPWDGKYSAETISTARGIDFGRMWNDEFGTPRDQQSTNPVMASFGQPEILPDPMFSWTRWQANEGWMRVHSFGEVIQDEELASQNHLRQGRRGIHGHPFPGMADGAVVVNLGVGIPNTSIMLTSTKDAIAWLDEEITMPGNDEAAGFTATRRWATQGYENFRNTKRLMEDDIPSVFEFNHHESIVDDSDAEDKVGFYVCTLCYDQTDDDRAGKYLPNEISTLDLTCPNPECDGVLFFMPSDEYRQGYLRATSYQVMPDEATRRMSGSSDSQSWQQTKRLQQMTCPNWSPRKWN